MSIRRPHIWPILLLLFFSSILFGQNIANTDEIPPQAINNLLQGKRYTPAYRHVKGTQYLTNDWKLGIVNYMDHPYADLPIWYDTYADELILLDWQGYGYGYIKLVRELIQSFTFDGRHFINPLYGSYKKYKLEGAFYEEVINDQITLLIRRSTEIRETNFNYEFVRKDKKILLKDGVLFELSNKKSLLKLLGDKDKMLINTYIKKNIRRFKDASDQDWVQLLRYYNNLLTQDEIN